MNIVLMDVDYTLYPRGTGPFNFVNRKIDEYVMQALGIGIEETKNLRKLYFGKYGSTLGGMMENHGTDPYEYCAYVHNVPVEELLVNDSRLREVLSEITLPIVAFTNASRGYVIRVLNALGIMDLFKDLFTIEDMGFIPKPRIEPYDMITERFGKDASDFICIDDRADNIDTAIIKGMQGIQVGGDFSGTASWWARDIFDVPQAIDMLKQRTKRSFAL